MYSKIRRSLIYRLYKLKGFLVNFSRIKTLDYEDKKILIYVDNFLESNTRAFSCSKEPETVDWIEKNCTSGTIFYDLGANIGAYSLVAATLGANVYSFEPAYQNFYKISQNITLNSLDSKIHCFPIAFSSSVSINEFIYQDTSLGTSRCFYNDSNQFRFGNNDKTIKKSTLIFSLDTFIKQFNLPQPEMIKIDVDGAEEDILKGACTTLSSKKLKTVLVEIDELMLSSASITSLMEENSFKLHSKHVRDPRTNNYIFIK